ncbi:MAG: glycosyltransferase family 4 protein [Muribaculaceae bacterium]
MFDIGGLNGSRINHSETPLIRFALRRMPAIVVHSSRQLEFYRKYYPKLFEKVTFIPFGADFNYFDHGLEIHFNYRIVSFGYAKRDFATLCKAFDELDNSKYELHIVGDSSLSKEYSHNSRIVFHEKMPIADLVRFILDSAFVAIPLPEYLYSYGQMSFLQSMALRKPLVVTDTTSSHDYVNGISGVLTPKPYDVADMKRCLAEMMSKDKGELMYMGLMNAEHVRNDLNEQVMGERVYRVVEEIMGED